MIFRLKFFIPIVLLIAGAYFAMNSISAALIKKYLEDSLPNLQIETLRVDRNDKAFGLVSRAKYSDNIGPICSVGRAELSLDSAPIGFGETIVKGNLEDVNVSARIFKWSASKDEASEESTSKEGFGGFSLSGLDHREVLERFTGQRQLETEIKIKEGEELVKKLSEKWTQRYKDMSTQAQDLKARGESWQKDWKEKIPLAATQEQIQQFRTELDGLKGKKFDVSNVAELANNIQKVQEYSKKVGELKEQIKSVKAQSQKELDQLKGLRQEFEQVKNYDDEMAQDYKALNTIRGEILVSGKKDIEMLKKELDPREFDADKLTRLLLGREWELKLKFYLDALDLLIKKFGPKEDAEAATPPPKKEPRVPWGEVSWVTYLREQPRPRWNIEKLRYAGTADQAVDGMNVIFEGFVENLSSDERVLKKTPSFTLQGKLPDQGGRLSIVGHYSSVINNTENRQLQFNLQGRALKGSSMGAPKMRVLFDEGNMAVSSHIDLASAPNWVVKGQIHLQDVILHSADTVQEAMKAPLKEAASRLFSSPIGFIYTYPGPMRFAGNLSEQVGSVFKGALTSLASQEQDVLGQKLQEKFDALVAEKLSGSSFEGLLKNQGPIVKESVGQGLKVLANLEQQKTGDLAKADQQQGLVEQLLSDALGLQGGQGQLKEQLQQKIKNEAQQRVEQEAKKQLEGQLLKRLGGASETPAKTDKAAEEKAPAAQPEKKEAPKDSINKNVDDLKKTFKGFGF